MILQSTLEILQISLVGRDVHVDDGVEGEGELPKVAEVAYITARSSKRIDQVGILQCTAIRDPEMLQLKGTPEKWEHEQGGHSMDRRSEPDCCDIPIERGVLKNPIPDSTHEVIEDVVPFELRSVDEDITNLLWLRKVVAAIPTDVESELVLKRGIEGYVNAFALHAYPHRPIAKNRDQLEAPCDCVIGCLLGPVLV